MISLEEAQQLLLAGVDLLASEVVDLPQASGRVLAADIKATHTQPAEPRSRMDGIAVASSTVEVGETFLLVGEAAAGAPFPGVLAEGQAVRIATGGVVPAGGVRVIPQESLDFPSTASARVREFQGDDFFIRQPGTDFRRGDLLLHAGSALHPGALGLVAAANHPTVAVRRRARVAILASGDELVPPGSELQPGSTIDTASFVLAALVAEWGGLACRLPPVADMLTEVEAELARCVEQFDVVVTIGGASVGARDHFRPAARALGMELPFERIAVQPGKPCWHARDHRGGRCLGLPGNPASAFVCAVLLLKPLLDRLHGRSGFALPHASARLIDRPVSSGSRRSFLRARLSDAAGELVVSAASDQDSGLQAALATANCLIDLAPGSSCSPGDMVRIVRLPGVA